MKKNKKNFGFGTLNKSQNDAITVLRQKICLLMAQHVELIGFKDLDDEVKALSMHAVNVCLEYVGLEKAKENPARFESFVKLVLSGIMKKAYAA